VGGKVGGSQKKLGSRVGPKKNMIKKNYPEKKKKCKRAEKAQKKKKV